MGHPVIILFKGGESNSLNNYEGITLLSILGELFAGIVNERFNKFAEKSNQFTKLKLVFGRDIERRSHFTLASIINHTLNVKNKTYVCFVDFKKAFDTVSHDRYIVE